MPASSLGSTAREWSYATAARACAAGAESRLPPPQHALLHTIVQLQEEISQLHMLRQLLERQLLAQEQQRQQQQQQMAQQAALASWHARHASCFA
jgi:hypothetical protein